MILRTVLVTLLAAVLALAADLTGSWTAEVETSAGSGSPSFVFRQEGEKLTGTYSGALGEAKLEGTVKGDNVEFSFKVAPQGESITVVYKGKLESPTAMRGTVSFAGLGEGTFSARRAK
jgi:hypothetical protein